MPQAFICTYLRTAIGRFGGALSRTRTDDLGAIPITALMEREKSVDWAAVDEVIFGCANPNSVDPERIKMILTMLSPGFSRIPGGSLRCSQNGALSQWGGRHSTVTGVLLG